MPASQTTYRGRMRPAPATSIWIVVDKLPGETPEDRDSLEQFRRELTETVDVKVREFLGGSVGQFQRSGGESVRAGLAKTAKLRILEEQT